jgi:cytochrome bd-type quinol oxidase subunit 2
MNNIKLMNELESTLFVLTALILVVLLSNKATNMDYMDIFASMFALGIVGLLITTLTKERLRLPSTYVFMIIGLYVFMIHMPYFNKHTPNILKDNSLYLLLIYILLRIMER